MKNIQLPIIKVGEVINPLESIYYKENRKSIYKSAQIQFPSRLDCMSLDPSLLDVNKSSVYTAGQLNFSVQIFKTVSVEIRDDAEIHVTPQTSRSSIITHAATIMMKGLGIKNGFNINYIEDKSLRHCGLGSSSALSSATAVAINELFGNPIPKERLIKYLAQNHGEEIDDKPEELIQVQSLGGSAACGMTKGAVLVISGQSCVIKTMELDPELNIVIGIPEEFISPDSKSLMEEEISSMDGFKESGNSFGKELAYRLVHETLPAMVEGDLRKVGEFIFDYRYKMGSIKNCSFVYPPIIEMADKLKLLFESGVAEVLSMSSVGPGMFVVTKQPELCEKHFKASGFKTYLTKPYNSTYKITLKKT